MLSISLFGSHATQGSSDAYKHTFVGRCGMDAMCQPLPLPPLPLPLLPLLPLLLPLLLSI